MPGCLAAADLSGRLGCGRLNGPMPAEPARPHQATLSGWMVVGGSLLIVLLAFDRIGGLGSIDAQEAAAQAVAEPPLNGLGVTADDLQLATRILCMIAGGCAASAAILGWESLRRSRPARLALTILAPLLVISALATAGVVGIVVAVAIAMMWRRPTSDWFAGRETPQPTPAGPRAGRAGPPSAGTPPQPTTPSGGAPEPWYGQSPSHGQSPSYGQSPSHAEQPAYSPKPDGHNPYRQNPDGQRSGTSRRPGEVTAACITAIVGSAIVLVLSALSAAAFGASSSLADTIERDLRAQDLDLPAGYSIEDLLGLAVGVFVVLAAWSLVAIVSAVLTMRGSNGARITLVVSSVIAALVSLLAIASVITLIWTAAAIATVVLLFTGDAPAWFRSRSRS